MSEQIIKSYEAAKNKYAKLGIDVDKALEKLNKIRISIHCWQGDDVLGFLKSEGGASGIQVTGNYPGRATNAGELRKDLEQVFKLIPGKHKLNLHAIYAESDKPIKLEEIEVKHFKNWINWAKQNQIGIDFNPTLFANEQAKDGLTLSHYDKDIRKFWINHVKKTREISSFIAKELNDKVIHNIWIPDGFKDYPYSRLQTRMNLKTSLDEIFKEEVDSRVIDTLESKLFGIGLEGFTVGSSEFYLSYAIKNNKGICFDSGHFHPTENVADKLSAVIQFVDHILLHVTRPMRWDSDHVVSYDDSLLNVAEACIRDDMLDKVSIGLDYFDASINRIAAWVIGIRNTQKAFLKALLEPKELLKDIEEKLDYTKRLILIEELKTFPIGAIYDYYCHINKIPTGDELIKQIEIYEKNILSVR